MTDRPVVHADMSQRDRVHVFAVHDYSLDGDEDLSVGKWVTLKDGDLEEAGEVIIRKDGYWYVHVGFPPPDEDMEWEEA